MINYIYFPDTKNPDENKQAQKRTYVCRYCHTVIVASVKPSNSGCTAFNGGHYWGTFAPIGKRPKIFVCRWCGLRINSSLTPLNGSPSPCVNGKNHSFSSM